jgi:hypothetical protein
MSRRVALAVQGPDRYDKGPIVKATGPLPKPLKTTTQVFPMTLIIAILLGLCLGQFVKVTPDPALIEFFRSAWALATEKAPLVKDFAAEKISEAVTTAKMGKLQKAVKSEFKKLDTEAKANG